MGTKNSFYLNKCNSNCMADADGKNPTERENLLMQKRKEELF
jgi:hypothetical protein